ncbi:MAG: fatty acid desaturase [Proteobacteria bacterium]|nr:fatty acid desaturase [Pseudomonadota bacterium]
MQSVAHHLEYKASQAKHIDWVGSIPFILMHIFAAGAFFWEFNSQAFWLCFISYYVRMIAVTAGYHRYFSHRAYKTSRPIQFLIGFMAQTSAQKGCLWWAANHRHHHKYSDTEKDLHSPSQHGFWWAQVGWILSPDSVPTNWKYIQDFAKFKELVWLNKFHLVPPTLYAVAIWLAFGWSGLFWGFFFSTMLLFHGTFIINSLTHMMGRVRYRSGDTSKNSFLLALITCGEGWHNNHHYYQATANQGWFWWEIDFSYYVIKLASWLGLTWDLRLPPDHIKAKTIAREHTQAAS